MASLKTNKMHFFLSTLLSVGLMVTPTQAAKASGYNLQFEGSNYYLLYTTIISSIAALWYACHQDKTPCPTQHNHDMQNKTFSFNQGEDETLSVQRIALGAEWGEPLFQNKYILFKGRTEVSYAQWRSSQKNPNNKSGFIVGLLPVNQIIYQALDSSIKPYLEIGAGPTFFDNIMVENENKSTQFQFGNLLGVGLIHKNFETSYRYIHYSNANIKTPNPGFDTINLNIGIRF